MMTCRAKLHNCNVFYIIAMSFCPASLQLFLEICSSALSFGRLNLSS